LNLKILSIAFNASSLAPKTLAVSTCAEKTVPSASFGGSAFYDYAISDTVKSTLNNWFSDTPEQKQQKFNIIIDGSSSEFKQAQFVKWVLVNFC
jgi:hypothetical protein